MLSKALLVLVALLVLQASAQTYDFVFAFSWLGGFCRGKNGENTCVREKYDLWDHQSFTIHGLWSQDRDSERIYGDFDLSLIANDVDLSDKLMNYMPPKTKPRQEEVFLWDHEWESDRDAHGQDFGNVVVNVFPQRYQGLQGAQLNKKIQQDFYHEIVKFYESFPGARKISQGRHSRESLANLFNLDPSSIFINCYSKTIVTELRVCATLSSNGFTPSRCQGRGSCSFNSELKLWDWRETSQTRVTATDQRLSSLLQRIRNQSGRRSSIQSETAKEDATTDDSSSDDSSSQSEEQEL